MRALAVFSQGLLGQHTQFRFNDNYFIRIGMILLVVAFTLYVSIDFRLWQTEIWLTRVSNFSIRIFVCLANCRRLSDLIFTQRFFVIECIEKQTNENQMRHSLRFWPAPFSVRYTRLTSTKFFLAWITQLWSISQWKSNAWNFFLLGNGCLCAYRVCIWIFDPHQTNQLKYTYAHTHTNCMHAEMYGNV